MSITIDQTGQTFGINQLDQSINDNMRIYIEDFLDVQNDYGSAFDDHLTINKKNTFKYYVDGSYKDETRLNLKLNIGQQQFINSANITDAIHAFISAETGISSFYVYENFNKNSPEKSGNIKFKISKIDTVTVCE